ncbi:MAG: hypothetical protein IPI66_10610 [Chitinophagaceae bacterium]|nr:hypothetical protein [Chitinophagaceae bacterium]
MKNAPLICRLCIASLFWLTLPASAQRMASIDIAGVRNIRHHLNGLNVSGFYHFSERFTGGIEMNRFFPNLQRIKGEEMELSSWDFDLNFHYLIPLTKKLKAYPLTGISHTSEKEWNKVNGEVIYDRFWSFNTGAGMVYTLGKWSPHIEYMFTWGHLNQQFLLAGLSYEVEW